jgi:hypothetical protein
LNIGALGHTHVDVRVLEVEVGLNIAEDLLIGLDDLFDLDLNEEVKGIYMLLDQPLNLEKGRQ